MHAHHGWSVSRILLTCAVVLGLSLTTLATAPLTASAQDDGTVVNDEYKTTVTMPEGWEKASGNEKAIAVFTHTGTQSQIEVVPTKLMTPDVAEVFFSTFYKTLKESNFKQEKQGDATYGTYKGKETVYSFDHSGITLKVYVFSFVKDTTAWLVVGYWQDSEQEKVSAAFKSTIETMKIGE